MTLKEFLYELNEQMDAAANEGNALLFHYMSELSDRIKKQLGIETPNCTKDETGETDLFFKS